MRPPEHELSPTALARLHWHQGGELADNPYPANTLARENYAMEMHRLQNMEFQALRQQIGEHA